ncbi:alpha/beta fold hydrolase [Streptosporangium roseum]|uniref:Hydrolase or acyltransferase (Alpha/beta hydrolase superfamily)-like protein n=1 Tax=Streptosporangium roseum (strain ATCC 12428 / DSM 43021 / JCM 3005 / KCTC 9067 / NCIMB 10171 / NRRL 2505 / NI 9100) TaxID=479432 RepID=D2B2D3_STRRD|nr:alpha/beta hydrolase [Streptosporangium roseum]ACZ91159.1 hydrolase or acyltransferase (alpha/beta hydrolase superfamily)-like protein [Streptosporangium roseum DSM 43021]
MRLDNRRVPTARITQNVLSAGETGGEAVLFVHGNVSSAAFWRGTLTALPGGYRPLAVDLRGFGDTDPAPVDATRGLRDYSDDVLALIDALGLTGVHLVGWSMGGGVVLQALRDRPSAVRSVTLVNPVSPYGFGGTHGPDGALNHPAGVGGGAGAANPDFVRLLAAGDRSDGSPVSPRNVFRGTYVKPGTVIEDEDALVESMLSTRVGEDNYPGDAVSSDVWPGVAPGTRGLLNALAPTYFRLDDLHVIDPKPPILWIRGEADVIVSDTSLFDLAHLGALGVVPGSPGTPAQPMVTQTRAALRRYGDHSEVVLDCGHSPHIERPEEFRAALVDHLKRS